MNIQINIECCDIDELKNHLHCLIEQIRKQQKVSKLSNEDEFEFGVCLEDNNCYGWHELKIVTEPV